MPRGRCRFADGLRRYAKASDANFRTPEITLSKPSFKLLRVLVLRQQSPAGPTGQRQPGNNGAPLIYAFVFNVKNPNDFPVLMDNMKFTVALTGSTSTRWVPGSGLDSRREDEPGAGAVRFWHVGSVHEPRGGRGMELQKMGKKPWDMLEKWWTKAPDFSFPVEVRTARPCSRRTG